MSSLSTRNAVATSLHEARGRYIVTQENFNVKRKLQFEAQIVMLTYRLHILGTGVVLRLRRQGIADKTQNYYDPRSAKMTEKDYAQAKVYGERAKQKYFNKRKSNDSAKHLSCESISPDSVESSRYD